MRVYEFIAMASELARFLFNDIIDIFIFVLQIFFYVLFDGRLILLLLLVGERCEVLHPERLHRVAGQARGRAAARPPAGRGRPRRGGADRRARARAGVRPGGAKTEDAAATLKTCAASETSDQALNESRVERYPREGSLRAPSERSERGEGSLASEKPQRKSAAPTSAQTPTPRRHRGACRRACSTARSTSRGVPRGSAHRRPSESLRAGLPPWRR